MFLAVPSMIRIAGSTPVAFRSGSLISAISRSCALVTDPTFSVLGLPDPFSTPAAFCSSTDAGGVLRMNVKERSSYTVISTGMIVPALSCVAALYCLQKSMMLTP